MAEFEKAITYIGKTKVNGYAGDYIFESIKRTGDFYEAETLKKWTPYLNSPAVLLDIGSNLGNHTLYWAGAIKDSHVIAFEPYAPNYQNLVRNIEDNGLSDRVQTVNAAVGAGTGKAVLKESFANNLGGTTFQMTEEVAGEVIPVTALDDFVEREGVETVDFIKIDTEGFEIDVLRGAKEILKKSRPIVWVEVSAESHAQVVNMLEEHRYELADMVGFNLLFIPAEKNQADLSVSRADLLRNLYWYAEKSTLHYQNYEKLLKLRD